MEPPSDNAQYLRELHRDLARKYRLHGTQIEASWRSLGQKKRTEAIKAGAAEGVVLKTPKDQSLGNVSAIMPEWNLRDLTKPDSDFAIDLLRHYATKPLEEQYATGVYGGPGDAEIIKTSMRENGLRYSKQLPYSVTLFMPGDQYGYSFTVNDPAMYNQVMSNFQPLVDSGHCVPQTTGELILSRQLYLMQALNVFVQDVLWAGKTVENNPKGGSKKSEKAAREALSALSLDQKPEKLSLEDLAARAFDQKCAFEDYLHLCRTEPAFLAHVVNIWFFSQPELIPDEKGRVLPVITDKYISPVVYESIHNAVVQAAIWTFIYDLVQMLVKGPKDRAYRATILQELSNICDYEYRRGQKLFKRYVQLYTGSGCFKRISNLYDDGQARVRIKSKPDSLAPMDSPVNLMLRLCQPETDFSRAVDLIKKLGQSRSGELEGEENLLESFGDLAVTVNFIQSLARSVQLPSLNRKQGQHYVSAFKGLTAELDSLKKDVDLSDFVIPLDIIEEPGKADGALRSLDQYIVDKTGAGIGVLYQDLHESCLDVLHKQAQQQQETTAQKQLETPLPEPPSPKAQFEQRKEKAKTRPPHSTVFSIIPETKPPAQETNTVPSQTYNVKQSTFDVFSTLFSSSESRGSVKWTAFEAAMADMGFSVLPSFGSVFTFVSPDGAAVRKSITFHRPHHSRIEGFRLLGFAKRLTRRFGWTEESFKLA